MEQPVYEYKRPSQREEENMRLRRLMQFQRDCKNPHFKKAICDLMGEEAVDVYLNRAKLAEAVFSIEENKPVNFLDISKIVLDD